jgi:hypothetical protein
VPYKTLLFSVHGTAAYVVREMQMDKYSLTRENFTNYCLVQVVPGIAAKSTAADGQQQ